MTVPMMFFMILGMFLCVRFVYSFEGEKGYSARKMLINFVAFMLYICSIPIIW